MCECVSHLRQESIGSKGGTQISILKNPIREKTCITLRATNKGPEGRTYMREASFIYTMLKREQFSRAGDNELLNFPSALAPSILSTTFLFLTTVSLFLPLS